MIDSVVYGVVMGLRLRDNLTILLMSGAEGRLRGVEAEGFVGCCWVWVGDVLFDQSRTKRCTILLEPSVVFGVG